MCKLSCIHLPRWPQRPFMLKTLKIVFSVTTGPIILKLRIPNQGLEDYAVYINDTPGFTLTYFNARSNLAAYAFEWKKMSERYLKANYQINRSFFSFFKLPKGPAPELYTILKHLQSLKQHCQSKQNFMQSLLGKREQKIIK